MNYNNQPRRVEVSANKLILLMLCSIILIVFALSLTALVIVRCDKIVANSIITDAVTITSIIACLAVVFRLIISLITRR